MHGYIHVTRSKVSEDIDERFHVDASLAKRASQGSHRQVLAMQRHHTGDAGVATCRVGRLSWKHHMAAFLSNHLKAQALQS